MSQQCHTLSSIGQGKMSPGLFGVAQPNHAKSNTRARHFVNRITSRGPIRKEESVKFLRLRLPRDLNDDLGEDADPALRTEYQVTKIGPRG